MPTLVTDDGQIITRIVPATVEVKNSLSDAAWTPVSHLYCDKLTLAVNAYDEAQISYELGEMVQPGTWAYVEYQPLDLMGKFVRVTCPQEAPLDPIRWVGVVIGSAKQRSAVKDAGPANLLTGKTQLLTAVGLEYFLDRVPIDSAVIFTGGGPLRVYRPKPFNGGKGVMLDYDTSQRGNRHPTTATTVYEFVGAGETGELWTAEQVISHLLFYHSSVNTTGAYAPIEFVVDAQDVLDAMLDGTTPTLDADGATVFQALNKLLSPQRGYVWWAEFDEPTVELQKVRIRVETLATQPITLPSLGTIPANRDQQTLDFDQQRDVDDVILAEAGSRIYHQVIARGARMTSTCTLGHIVGAENELRVDWLSEIVEEYEDGVDGATAEENDAFRKAEKFYRVFMAFRLWMGEAGITWDFKSGDGFDAARNWTFPVLSDTGSIIDTLPVNIEGLRLLNLTRLKRDWNYADVSNIIENTPDGTEAEYQPLFAIVNVAIGNEGESNNAHKFQFVDKMSKTEFEGNNTPVSDDIHTSYDIGAQQNTPGILLRAHGMNHAMALNNWPGEAGETTSEPEVDFTTLRVTCTLEADAYCEAKWPADADLPANVPLQKLLLYVGEEYRLDFLAANTVVGLNNGEPVLTNGGVLRDDRADLKDIARVAYEWYQLGRLPLTVRFRNTRNLFRLGMLITTVGTSTTLETINTVVSMIEYNFFNGTTTIKTNDQDLDLVRVA